MSTPSRPPIEAAKRSRKSAASPVVLCIFQLAATSGLRFESGICERLHPGQLAALHQLQRRAAAGREPVDAVAEPEGDERRGRVPAADDRRPRGARRRPRPPPGCRPRTAPARTLPSARSRTRCPPPRSPRRTRPRCGGRCRGPSSRSGPRPRRAPGARRRRRSGRRSRGRPAAGARTMSPPPRPSTRRASSTPSSSTSESPTSTPCARKNEKHIAPPTRSWSARSRNASITPILSPTLAPPRTTQSGRAGSSRTNVSSRTSRSRSRPAYAGRCSATPSVVACARWAAPNASFTYSSARAARARPSSGSFFVSPGS